VRLKLRCSDDNKFGFVEKYETYAFKTGAVKIRAIANAGGYFAEPYIYRKGEFVPASKIDEEMGIFRYIRAKKPMYSVIGTGNVILDIRVAYDLKTFSIISDKSYFNVYGVVKDSLSCENDEWYIDIRKLTSTNDDIEKWLNALGKKLALMGCDKKDFLKSRMKG